MGELACLADGLAQMVPSFVIDFRAVRIMGNTIMAGILDRYGIKEVADITFYHLNSKGKPDYPVLFIDTAKTSTIEVTAETTDARGGKGNPKLITWDYGKEITVTLEDALFSARSMAIMFGNGTVSALKDSTEADATGKLIMRTEKVDASLTTDWVAKNGKVYKRKHITYYDAAGASSSTYVDANTAAGSTTGPGESILATYDLVAINTAVITISAESFPGTYYVTGDTFARNEANGEDEFFQFIIPKAKITSENTITLEAEGDPSVFSMNLTVLRPADGNMMYLVKYDLDGNASKAPDAVIYHNHDLPKAAAEEANTAG